MKKLSIIFLCLCLLMCGGCGAAQTKSEPADPASALTEPAEEPEAIPTTAASDTSALRFTTTDREGNTWDESVFAQHNLTMINFWEPWCGPCVGEMPELQNLYENYADRDLLILGVYGTPDMEEDVDDILAQTGVKYPVLNYCEAFSVFESGYVPTTIFVDREGHVLHRTLNPEEKSELADVIQTLGEEQTSALYIGACSYDEWAAIIDEWI